LADEVDKSVRLALLRDRRFVLVRGRVRVALLRQSERRLEVHQRQSSNRILQLFCEESNFHR